MIRNSISEYAPDVRKRCRESGKSQSGIILTEFCLTTVSHPKPAMWRQPLLYVMATVGKLALACSPLVGWRSFRHSGTLRWCFELGPQHHIGGMHTTVPA